MEHSASEFEDVGSDFGSEYPTARRPARSGRGSQLPRTLAIVAEAIKSRSQSQDGGIPPEDDA